MRGHAVLRSAAGLTPFGHLAWSYTERSEFLHRAAEYIADGLRHNQYIAYAGEGTRDALLSELAAIPGIAEHLDSGRIEAFSAEDYYTFCPGTDVIDSDAAVARYLSAARQAIANGYSGFRAVSDVTSVARTPAQRDGLARLEYLVDQQMAVLPFSAMCAYNARELGSAAGELMCLHPFVNAGSVMFRLYADRDTGTDFTLAGEIDAGTNDLFDTTLHRVWPLVPGHTMRIGADELKFISHQRLCLLESQAREQNRNVILSTNQPTVSRLVDLLDLTHVQVAESSQ